MERLPSYNNWWEMEEGEYTHHPRTITKIIFYVHACVGCIVRILVEIIVGTLALVSSIVRDLWIFDLEYHPDEGSDEDSNSKKRKEEGPIRRIFFPPLTGKRILMLLCVAVSIDPLFFYVPVINNEKKCLAIDKNLRAAALCLRALPDAAFALHSISSGFRLYPFVELHFVQVFVYSFASILVAVFLMLPIPQLAIAVSFFKPGGSGHLGQIVTVNIFLFLYYVARIVLIRIYSQKVKYQYNIGIWFRASFNFFFYMVASNVLGGFWYFFSIQREISCWQSCRNGAGCRATYYCSDSTPRDITFLDELCPVNPQNAAIFNFGIFLEAIQSGITRSRHFPTKFFYCVWWGIRNLSNFGTNLQTSSYVWETCFAIVISITGLLLFLYLIGNVQIYMQHVKTKSLEDEEKTKKLKKKTISKRRQIRGWMIDHGIPLDEARNIMQQIKYHKLVDDINADEEVDLKYIFSVLYDSGRNLLQHHLCMETLKQVDHLRNMDEKMVKIICDHMKLKIFDDKEYIIEAEKPLEVMMIIVEGLVQVYPSTRHAAAEAPSAQTFKEGDILGRELVDWAAMTTHDRPLISFQIVQCLTKVAAFVLKIEDLKRLVISKRIIFRRN